MVMEGFTMILGVALHRASDRKFSNAKNLDARGKEGGAEPKRERERAFTFSSIFADRRWRLWRRSADPGAGGNVRVDVNGPH